MLSSCIKRIKGQKKRPARKTMRERTVPYQTGSDIRSKIFFRTVERERDGNLRAVNGRYLAGAYAVVLQPCLNRYNAFVAVRGLKL